MKSQEKSIEVVINKIDEEKSAVEYLLKEKEKEKNSKNCFNKITFIQYEFLNPNNNEIDFLFDYSKILGPQNNDSKIIQWQMLNKDRLFPYGIDIIVLNKRFNEIQNKGTTDKMNNIISNLNYRLQRHGRLAPTRDIAKKLQKKLIDEQLPLAEEEEADGEKEIDIEQEDALSEKEKENIKEKDKNNIFYSGNEENFYDINDPFIDDNLDEISEIDNSNKLLFNLSLAPGNYTEAEILQNLKKNHKIKKFKKIKKSSKKGNFEGNKTSIINDIKENDSMVNAINNIINQNQPKSQDTLFEESTFMSKKTKRDPSYNSHNSDNEKNKKKRKFDKSQLTDMSYENIQKLFHQIITEYSSPIMTEQQKVSFINRNIKNISEIYSRNSVDLCKVVHKEFNMSLDIANLLIEYMIFKSKIENIYSNFSKYLKNLNMALNINGISKISSFNELDKYSNADNEIDKSIKHVIDNIYNFRLCFNEYIGRHYNDLYEIHNKLYPYIKDIRERNKGIILKLSCKFDELEKDFEGKISREIIIDYLKLKYSSTNFSEDFSDERNRIYSLETFVYKDKGNNTKIFKEPLFGEDKENKFTLNKIITEPHKDFDTCFNNLSFEKAISTSINSPSKNSSKTNVKNKYILFINKDKDKKYPEKKFYDKNK
jgi:hypothetical protein